MRKHILLHLLTYKGNQNEPTYLRVYEILFDAGLVSQTKKTNCCLAFLCLGQVNNIVLVFFNFQWNCVFYCVNCLWWHEILQMFYLCGYISWIFFKPIATQRHSTSLSTGNTEGHQFTVAEKEWCKSFSFLKHYMLQFHLFFVKHYVWCRQHTICSQLLLLHEFYYWSMNN
jgi:hypothetical protein